MISEFRKALDGLITLNGATFSESETSNSRYHGWVFDHQDAVIHALKIAESMENCRESFEKWFSDNGEFPKAIEKYGGEYRLMGAQTSWTAWKAAYEFLKEAGGE